MKKFIRSDSTFCRLQDCFLNICSTASSNAKASTFRPHSTHVNKVSKFGIDNAPIFKPCRVAILSRITRYEFEKLRHKGISEEGLKEKVTSLLIIKYILPIFYSFDESMTISGEMLDELEWPSQGQ